MSHLQDPAYTQLSSLPVEEPFNARWSGYASTAADPLL